MLISIFASASACVDLGKGLFFPGCLKKNLAHTFRIFVAYLLYVYFSICFSSISALNL